LNHGLEDIAYTTSATNYAIGDYDFKLSSHGIYSGELRIGHNKTGCNLSSFGLSDSGCYIEALFNTNNLKKIKATINKEYGGNGNWYVYFTKAGEATYLLVNSGSFSTEVANDVITAELDNASNGHFTIVFTSSKARIVLGEYNLYTE
ncbi:MAG: hypothetical protein IJA65_03900, partial [Acholeplasmatales bacterium]|nr:hypothetical protein [Acholeplasmatales bacterium]